MPPKTARLRTAATIATLECGPKKPDPEQQLSPTVPTQIASHCAGGGVDEAGREFCVIEQHIGKLLEVEL